MVLDKIASGNVAQASVCDAKRKPEFALHSIFLLLLIVGCGHVTGPQNPQLTLTLLSADTVRVQSSSSVRYSFRVTSGGVVQKGAYLVVDDERANFSYRIGPVLD